MNDLPTLEGRLVTLGRFTPEHDQVYLGWMQDEHILKMTGSDRSETLEEIREIREWFTNSFSIAHFLIFDKSGVPIGDADLRNIRPGYMAESTIMIGEEPWRKRGYAREAFGLLIDFGFDRFAFERIYAKILRENKASMALVRKFGFEVTGSAEDYLLFEKKSHNVSYEALFVQPIADTQFI